MDINAAFPSKYLKHSDITPPALVLTISHVVIEEVGDGDHKPVVYFADRPDQGLVLNKTNAGTISQLYGSDTDNWEGRKIALVQAETDFGGKRVPCIRVSIKKPGAPPNKEQTQDLDNQVLSDGGSDIPF